MTITTTMGATITIMEWGGDSLIIPGTTLGITHGIATGTIPGITAVGTVHGITVAGTPPGTIGVGTAPGTIAVGTPPGITDGDGADGTIPGFMAGTMVTTAAIMTVSMMGITAA